MKTVNIHEAKTHLSRLIEAAVKGEAFIIAKSGKPQVKVMSLEEMPKKKRVFGFLKSKYEYPTELDKELDKEIEDLFYSSPLEPDLSER